MTNKNSKQSYVLPWGKILWFVGTNWDKILWFVGAIVVASFYAGDYLSKIQTNLNAINSTIEDLKKSTDEQTDKINRLEGQMDILKQLTLAGKKTEAVIDTPEKLNKFFAMFDDNGYILSGELLAAKKIIDANATNRFPSSGAFPLEGLAFEKLNKKGKSISGYLEYRPK